jgi:hypothetical protein
MVLLGAEQPEAVDGCGAGVASGIVHIDRKGAQDLLRFDAAVAENSESGQTPVLATVRRARFRDDLVHCVGSLATPSAREPDFERHRADSQVVREVRGVGEAFEILARLHLPAPAVEALFRSPRRLRGSG